MKYYTAMQNKVIDTFVLFCNDWDFRVIFKELFLYYYSVYFHVYLDVHDFSCDTNLQKMVLKPFKYVTLHCT